MGYDYYLFWAEEIFQTHFETLIFCDSLQKVQIACTHIVMDEGAEDYHKDGFVVAEIVWHLIQQKLKDKAYN